MSLADRALRGLLRPGERTPPPLVALHIGEFRASARAEVLYTLLGSCVAVCLYDPGARVGGMNHILLPGRGGEDAMAEDAARFGHDAVQLLARDLAARGARPERLRAKLFGGGHVIPQMDERTSPGFRNVAFIREFMQRERVAVEASDLGGYEARKVWFRTDTADVLLTRVPVRLAGEVAREEQRFRSRVFACAGARG